VEDEEPIRELINLALAGRGYKVHICPDSTKVVALAESLPAPPDLLITDIHMAGLSGPDLAADMVNLFPGLCILFVSGYANTSEQVRSALTFENSGFLRKPFSLTEFRQHVDGVLGHLLAPKAAPEAGATL
jgi:DNA-binding response OmpR family regulator